MPSLLAFSPFYQYFNLLELTTFSLLYLIHRFIPFSSFKSSASYNFQYHISSFTPSPIWTLHHHHYHLHFIPFTVQSRHPPSYLHPLFPSPPPSSVMILFHCSTSIFFATTSFGSPDPQTIFLASSYSSPQELFSIFYSLQ